MKDNLKKTIGIIGYGHMGSALIGGMVVKHFREKDDFIVWDKDHIKSKAAQGHGVRVAHSSKELVLASNEVILAVKPQQMQEVLQEIRPYLAHHPLIISIAAGISTEWIRRQIGDATVVVRAMPNSATQVGEGMSAIAEETVDGQTVSDIYLKEAESILENVGKVVRVPERLIDAVTAISGSGPAYFFYLMEQMIKTGVALGLSEGIARHLVIETARGAAQLAAQAKESPETLRARVTSKGGTTEAAFREFAKGHLDQVLELGIRAAAQRAKELTP